MCNLCSTTVNGWPSWKSARPLSDEPGSDPDLVEALTTWNQSRGQRHGNIISVHGNGNIISVMYGNIISVLDNITIVSMATILVSLTT